MANSMMYFTLGLFLLIRRYSDNVMAADSDPLQDFCVADEESKVLVNGFVCKDPKEVSADDFFFRGLGQPGNTDNAVGSNVTAANVKQIPGLNTLGISLARIDFAVGGINPPHTHPRATEILVLLEGELLVGFIDTDNKFFSKTLEKGDVFVFPKALVHFQQNVGQENAIAIAGLSSQFPGVQTIANSLFAADPPLPDSASPSNLWITFRPNSPKILKLNLLCSIKQNKEEKTTWKTVFPNSFFLPFNKTTYYVCSHLFKIKN